MSELIEKNKTEPETVKPPEHRMSDQEREAVAALAETPAWNANLPLPDALRAQKLESRKNEAKLAADRRNIRLWGAAMCGDANAAREALATEGNDKASLVSYAVPSGTALDLSLFVKAGTECVIEWVKAGCGSSQRSDSQVEWKEGEVAKKPKEDQCAVIWALARHATVETLRKASEVWREQGLPAPDDRIWLLICLKAGSPKYAKAWEICQSDAGLINRELWTEIAKNCHNMEHCAPEDQEAFYRFHREASHAMGPKAARSLYATAVSRDNAERIKALLTAGLRPCEGWTIMANPQGLNEAVETPLVISAMRRSDQCYALLSKFEPAFKSSREKEINPATLMGLSLTQVVELHGKGVRVDSRNAAGENILHGWAREDYNEPRAGWATLARKMPRLLEDRDSSGRTAMAVQTARLGAASAERFEASLSRIESMALRKEIAPVKKSKKTEAARPRSRL